MKKLLFVFIILFAGSMSAQLVNIDASKDAFYDGLTNPDDGKIFMPWTCYLRDVGSVPPTGGDADISAIVWSCWDVDYMYFYVEVKDEIIMCNNTTNWSNDKMELKFDPDPTQGGASGAIQVGMSALGLGDAQEDAAVDDLNADNTSGTEMVNAANEKWVSTEDDWERTELADGYILEFRIPFAYLNKGTRLLPPVVEGLQFGMAINIADNDATARDNMLQWSAGHVDVAWTNPSKHGTVTLLANNKVKFEAKNLIDPTVVNDSEYVWYFGGTAVSVPTSNEMLSSFQLMQNYPNPFNPSTIITYNLAKQENISLTVYNITGQEVKTLVSNEIQNAGLHRFEWNAKNNKGIDVPSGVYFYQVKYGNTIATKKMMLMR